MWIPCSILYFLFFHASLYPAPLWTPALFFFFWGFFSTLYLRLHQAVTSKFSLESYTTLVYLFVLQPNAKPSLAVMSLIEDHSPEPSLEILKLLTSVRRECEVRQHKTFMYWLCWAFNKNEIFYWLSSYLYQCILSVWRSKCVVGIPLFAASTLLCTKDSPIEEYLW